ncbi:MAG: hypothetical protein IJR13_02160 [Bacteroidales bacterium]|nr:hypothetical protein [Bacteroidales bacterium]
MKRTTDSIALAVAMGVLMLAGCEGGSEAYKDAKSALKEQKNAIKKAESCTELEMAIKYADAYSNSSECSMEENLKLLEQMEELENLYNEKKKKLCND